jgi:hypothetical protein
VQRSQAKKDAVSWDVMGWNWYNYLAAMFTPVFGRRVFKVARNGVRDLHH